MTFDLAKYEKDADFQAYITEIVNKAVAPLTTKRDELLNEVTGYKTKLKDIPTKEELDALRAAATELGEVKKKSDSGKTEYEKMLEKMRKDTDTYKGESEKTINALKGNLKKTLVEGGLAKALVSVNINPALASAAIKLLATDVAFIEENGEFVAKVGDKDIDTFVKEWANTAVGKNFVLAKPNSGGGSEGDGGNGETFESHSKFFDKKSSEYSMTKQAALYKVNPALYNKLIEKFS